MTLNQKVKYRGIGFEYGDDILIVAPLPLDDVKEIEANHEAIPMIESPDVDGVKQPSRIDASKRLELRREAIHRAIRRNYPDLTDADLKDFVTLHNVNQAYAAAMGAEEYPPGKSLGPRIKSPGELTPVDGSAPIGATSTGASPP